MNKRPQPLRRYIGVVLTVFAVVTAFSLWVNNPEKVRREAIQRNPDLAAVLTGDWSRNECITDHINQLRAARADYAQAAAMVCDVARKFH
jgi:hypothetical protein